MTRVDFMRYAASFGLTVTDDTMHAATLIVAEALDSRSNKGLSSPEQVERLIGHGYNPDLVLSLSWAHAQETLRLLGVDNVHTPKEAP